MFQPSDFRLQTSQFPSPPRRLPALLTAMYAGLAILWVLLLVVVLALVKSFSGANEQWVWTGGWLLLTSSIAALGILVYRREYAGWQRDRRLRDVFDRLQEERDILRSILDTLDEGVVVISNGGECRPVNDAAAQMLRKMDVATALRNWLESAELDSAPDTPFSSSTPSIGSIPSIPSTGSMDAPPDTDPVHAQRINRAIGRHLTVAKPVPADAPTGKKDNIYFLWPKDRAHTPAPNIPLGAVVNQSADAILIADPEGRIEYVNEAFERLSGYTRAELLGQNPRIFKSGRQDPALYRDLWESLSQGKLWKGCIINQRKDGTQYEVEASLFPVRSADGAISHFVADYRDVTYQRRVEAQLRQSRHLEAIGSLAGGIAHDFNNILAAIVGYTELAINELPEKNSTRLDLQEVLKAGERARDLIQQILTFSRQTEQEKRPIQLATQVREALKLFRATLPTTIEIRQDFDPGAGSILADPTQIDQVLLNLVTNAHYAMRDHGGVLEVSLQAIEFDAESARVHAGLAPGPYVRLGMSDTGRGMDRDTIERIFEPYFTTKGPEGTGLGLSTVQGIVARCGGAVTVYSEPGRGTAFHVYFPRVDVPQTHEVFTAPEAPRGRQEHLLLVDDEPVLMHFGKRILERLGYRVTPCNDPTEALDLFRVQPDAFHLLVTDQTMPHLTGLELAQEIRRLRPDLPVIITTGFSDLLTKERAQANHINAIIMKPVIARDLATAVRRALDTPKQPAPEMSCRG